MRMGTGRTFHEDGPVMKKALDPVLAFIRGTTNLFEFVERRCFEHFVRTSKSARYAGWMSILVWKLMVHILNECETLQEANVIVLG